MSEPANLEEFNAKFHANVRYFGNGIAETGMAMPCPFCAEPDFLTYKIMETEEALEKGAVCAHCQRGMRARFENSKNVSRFHCVQTCGPDPSPWLPKMERTDE